jgi:hypothetical protein
LLLPLQPPQTPNPEMAAEQQTQARGTLAQPSSYQEVPQNPLSAR